MAVYHKEWPLLVLTPSGARYHWESEFRNWLGWRGAAASKKLEEFSKFEDSKPLSDEAVSASGHDFPLLEDSQIHVLSSSKGPVIPNSNTRIVICSYGLAPMLAKDDAIRPGMFKCAIADESHMMKNSKSKRTQFLLPILKACNRCLLLSGTPAFARASELWPQLQILASDKYPGFWNDENDFMDKYVKNGNAARRAELHTMLTGTLMIRRLKDDILKDMPRKAREKAVVAIPSPEMKIRMKECMDLLRQGKGVMAKLARQHSATADATTEDGGAEDRPGSTVTSAPADAAATPFAEQVSDSVHQLLTGQRPTKIGTDKEALLEQSTMTEYRERVGGVHQAIQVAGHRQPYTNDAKAFLEQQQEAIYNELKVRFREGLEAIRGAGEAGEAVDEIPARAAVLNQMYGLTGESKIPAVVSFLSKWLGDPAKGKICVFAHHIFMLDAIAKGVRLSNGGERGTYKYIRIDGKTSPKNRQEQIDNFQNDPTVRLALLGITAAGVAVTLTAASEVLFAELFWTPAM
jgi:SNF2 family DNA or RNA helicase